MLYSMPWVRAYRKYTKYSSGGEQIYSCVRFPRQAQTKAFEISCILYSKCITYIGGEGISSATKVLMDSTSALLPILCAACRLRGVHFFHAVITSERDRERSSTRGEIFNIQ